MNNMEIAAVRSGLGGAVAHTELKVMKFKETMNKPGRINGEKKLKNEHKQMAKNEVWESLEEKDLPEGVKNITST